MLCQLKSCVRCHGDLVLEENEWHCFQCGRYCYPTISRVEPIREGQGVNACIASRVRSEQNWWARNALVIGFLDEGMSVNEIAALRNLMPRKVAEIKQTLGELRAISGQG